MKKDDGTIDAPPAPTEIVISEPEQDLFFNALMGVETEVASKPPKSDWLTNFLAAGYIFLGVLYNLGTLGTYIYLLISTIESQEAMVYKVIAILIINPGWSLFWPVFWILWWLFW